MVGQVSATLGLWYRGFNFVYTCTDLDAITFHEKVQTKECVMKARLGMLEIIFKKFQHSKGPSKSVR